MLAFFTTLVPFNTEYEFPAKFVYFKHVTLIINYQIDREREREREGVKMYTPIEASGLKLPGLVLANTILG